MKFNLVLRVFYDGLREKSTYVAISIVVDGYFFLRGKKNAVELLSCGMKMKGFGASGFSSGCDKRPHASFPSQSFIISS